MTKRFCPGVQGPGQGGGAWGEGRGRGPRSLRHQVYLMRSRVRAAASFFPEDVKSRVAGTT